MQHVGVYRSALANQVGNQACRVFDSKRAKLLAVEQTRRHAAVRGECEARLGPWQASRSFTNWERSWPLPWRVHPGGMRRDLHRLFQTGDVPPQPHGADPTGVENCARCFRSPHAMARLGDPWLHIYSKVSPNEVLGIQNILFVRSLG